MHIHGIERQRILPVYKHVLTLCKNDINNPNNYQSIDTTNQSLSIQ